MRLLQIIAMAGLSGLAALATPPAKADSKPTVQAPARRDVHRIVVQVSQNDPVIMNLALNNAENLVKYYESKGEKVQLEFVAYGPGLHMVRNDTSPVKDRLTSIASSTKSISFSGCANTMSNQGRAENKDITLVSEARTVHTGIGRIVELQEQGWTYVRP